MEALTLTPHQQDAVDTVVARLVNGEPLLALKGLAGTGKTSIIPAIQTALHQHGLATTIGAPTHRAAMILRQKGLEADTVHAQALLSYFTVDYRQACLWLGELLPTRLDDTTEPRPDVEGLPWLVYEAVKPDLEQGRQLRRKRTHTARRLLASVGIRPQDYFAGSAPKAGAGVLIIDEASMVGRTLLALCQQAFPHVLLVGDPGQLAPVKDEDVLYDVEGVELTELHRQAEGSPIVQLAYQARRGQSFWQRLDTNPLSIGAPIRAVDEAAARRFRICPLLVWRNDIRVACTKAIREALGYTSAALVKGEPLVCRATAPEDRALGFFNNGLYTITEVFPDDPRRATVKDLLGDTMTIWLHMEEVDGNRPDPKAIPFRFGYCLTVHTAQGGEWPRVYVSLPELRRYAAMAQRTGTADDFTRWSYTAITRAKESIRFLTKHTFTSHHETYEALDSMAPEQTTSQDDPLLMPLPGPLRESSPLVAAPASTEAEIFGTDDIPEIPVPQRLQEALQDARVDPLTSDLPLTPAACLPEKFGEHEALLQGFCQHLVRRFDATVQSSQKDMEKACESIYGFVKRQLEVQKEKAEQAETLLNTLTSKALQEGLQLRHDPYTVTVQTMSPQGFPVTLALAKHDKGELVEELGAMVQWLAREGYKPVG